MHQKMVYLLLILLNIYTITIKKEKNIILIMIKDNKFDVFF